MLVSVLTLCFAAAGCVPSDAGLLLVVFVLVLTDNLLLLVVFVLVLTDAFLLLVVFLSLLCCCSLKSYIDSPQTLNPKTPHKS